MDPFKAATAFFTRLMDVDGWQTMAPSHAAHAVQINADPNYYTPFYAPATAIVQGLVSTGGAGACAIGGDAVRRPGAEDFESAGRDRAVRSLVT